MSVYIICFNKPYRHAHHYIGSSEKVEERIQEHRAGRGARLMTVVNQAGIGWDVVAVLKGGRKEERKLKNRKNAAGLCPNCKNSFLERQRINQRQARAKKTHKREQ